MYCSLIYSNMSAVQLKRGNWARGPSPSPFRSDHCPSDPLAPFAHDSSAISCADDALKKNPKNIKAAYRKATALHSNGASPSLFSIEAVSRAPATDHALYFFAGEPFKAKRVLKDLGDLTGTSSRR